MCWREGCTTTSASRVETAFRLACAEKERKEWTERWCYRVLSSKTRRPSSDAVVRIFNRCEQDCKCWKVDLRVYRADVFLGRTYPTCFQKRFISVLGGHDERLMQQLSTATCTRNPELRWHYFSHDPRLRDIVAEKSQYIQLLVKSLRPSCIAES